MLTSKRRFWTTGQLAESTGLSERTIKRYCDDGTIAVALLTPGGHRRIASGDAEAFLRQRRPALAA